MRLRILPALAAAVAKDLTLIMRDRVGLVFLTLAPMMVITVAGFSLANLFGGRGAGERIVVPLVDEDGGEIGEAIRRRLASEPDVVLERVESRAAAVQLLRERRAAAALVVPASASAAQREGRTWTLTLLTDPVKMLEVGAVRELAAELRHRITADARDRAAARLAATRREAERARAELAAALEETRRARDRLGSALAEARRDAERRRLAAGETLRRQVADAIASADRRTRERVARRLDDELAPVRGYLAELETARRTFEAWLAAVRERAGNLADRMPAPPAVPAPPPGLARLASTSAEDLVGRLLPPEERSIELPRLDALDLPAIPVLPAIALPALPTLPAEPLPGTIEIDEQSATGAPKRPNAFDQNVPGFSVTFLLLGMLLGVSVGLLDERDWGTFERLRSMPTPFAVILVSKILSRLAVGVVQMALLFAVGRVLFGISLGPQPWALALPTAGIVFAGTSFGLVVAGLARSREAVMPIGSIAVITMAAVGGCWWPIDMEPAWMRALATVFPTTWAMAAYNDLMIRRLGVEAALWPTTVLMAHGLAYAVAGIALVRRRV